MLMNSYQAEIIMCLVIRVGIRNHLAYVMSSIYVDKHQTPNTKHSRKVFDFFAFARPYQS